MAYRAGKETTNLDSKCGTCKYYEPLIKMDKRMGFNVEYCRGKCNIAMRGCGYKTRTESCKRWEEVYR